RRSSGCWLSAIAFQVEDRGGRYPRGSSAPAPLALGGIVVGGEAAGAGPQGLTQGDGAAGLAQGVGEGVVGQLLQRFQAVLTEELERVPGLGVEFDQLAGHGPDPCSKGVRPLSPDLYIAATALEKGSDPGRSRYFIADLSWSTRSIFSQE